MSQERYGIRRFALLNTAGYSLGIFPLENPLSVYGANNLGKSASINALQFPILARMSDMSFGKYSLEQSRKFYFASDTSYILVEVMLPHGPHVIGVAGRGRAAASVISSSFIRARWTSTITSRTAPACASASCSPTSNAPASRPTRPSRTSCAGCWSAGIPRSRWT